MSKAVRRLPRQCPADSLGCCLDPKTPNYQSMPSTELFAYLGNAPTLPRAAAPPPPLRNWHEYLRRILRSPELVRSTGGNHELPSGSDPPAHCRALPVGGR
jgi:hypothetical protein